MAKGEKMKSIINTETKVCHNKEIIASEIDGQIVMMSMENDAYFGMENVASRIWKLIENPVSVNELCQKLIEEYDVSELQCQADVIQFLQEMAEKKVVSIAA